jgi:tartrate dehydrogenase/decarboxylase/D-malate dehydrogenase
MNTYTIPVIPGDGIGREVIAEGRKVLDVASDACGFSINWRELPYGADYYLEHGEILPESALREIAKAKAVYFGACGDPRVEPGILERGLVIAIRNYCDQFVNLRPVRLLKGVQGPLRDKQPKDIDLVVVRENTEDFYVATGARLVTGHSKHRHRISRHLYELQFEVSVESNATEGAYQVGIVTREGIRRVLVYAFELARLRRGLVTSVDKANVLTEVYGLWRDEFARVAADFPDIRTEQLLVDAAAMMMIRNPERFDVLVTPNMFGDILSEIGAAIQGGLGFSPAGNLNPGVSGMFEPIHGSAPQLAGLGQANPIASIWAGAMMLEFLGEVGAAKLVVSAIEKVIEGQLVLTPDMGGESTTSQVGDEIAGRLKNMAVSSASMKMKT